MNFGRLLLFELNRNREIEFKIEYWAENCCSPFEQQTAVCLGHALAWVLLTGRDADVPRPG
jgi:hypothetical protein